MSNENDLYELPNGWEWAKLDDIIKIVRGISFPKESKTYENKIDHIACLRTANVQREVDWSSLWFVPKEFVKRDDQIIQERDILTHIQQVII